MIQLIPKYFAQIVSSSNHHPSNLLLCYLLLSTDSFTQNIISYNLTLVLFTTLLFARDFPNTGD